MPGRRTRETCTMRLATTIYHAKLCRLGSLLTVRHESDREGDVDRERLRILVVDDDKDVRNFVETVLMREEIEACFAADGPTALALLGPVVDEAGAAAPQPALVNPAASGRAERHRPPHGRV